MKKINIIFPLFILSLVGCHKSAPKKKQSSSLISSFSTTQITSVESTAVERPGEYRFKQKEGEWEVYIDLENYYLDYKREFPYVTADSGIQIFDFANLSFFGNGCYISSYNAKGFILMKNTGGYASKSGLSFLANDAPLYHIEELRVTSASTSDKNVNFNLYIGNEPVSRTGGYTLGKNVGLEGSISGDGSYFSITQTNEKVDGKLSSIYVKYRYEIPAPEVPQSEEITDE